MGLTRKQYKRQRKSRNQQKRLKKRKQQKRKTKKRGRRVRKGGIGTFKDDIPSTSMHHIIEGELFSDSRNFDYYFKQLFTNRANVRNPGHIVDGKGNLPNLYEEAADNVILNGIYLIAHETFGTDYMGFYKVTYIEKESDKVTYIEKGSDNDIIFHGLFNGYRKTRDGLEKLINHHHVVFRTNINDQINIVFWKPQ